MRDICQKLVPANGWSLVGFAGDLCLGRHLLNGIVTRLQNTEPNAANWLKDNQELKEFVREGTYFHAWQKADHIPCQSEGVALLIAWMDYSRSIIDDDLEAREQTFVPGTEIVVIQTPGITVSRIQMGLDIIGSGAVIAQRIRDGAFWKIANFARGHEYEQSIRCCFSAEVVLRLLSNANVPTVGGLLQMASLSRSGVEVVPYFYWAPVEPGYGTYVAMRIEDGFWMQEHRPTGVRIRVKSPFEIDPGVPYRDRGKHEMFDPARMLTRRSPGVLPERSVTIQFHLYEPADVPDEIRASWGNELLPPLSYAT